MKKIQPQLKLSVIQPPRVGPMTGRYDHAHAVHRHRHALLLARKAFHQDGLRNGLQRAAAEPLQHAEEDEQAERGRHAAEQAADGEEADADHVKALAPDAAWKTRRPWGG